VVFDAPSALEVMRLLSARRWVVRSGSVVAETTPASTRLFHEGREERVTFSPPKSAD
jgi:hypothetical protein